MIHTVADALPLSSRFGGAVVVCFALGLLLQGCYVAQTPPPAISPGSEGRQGDAGWHRVKQVNPGQRILLYVSPPVEQKDGLEARTRDGNTPPINDLPPYDVPLQFWAELISVSDSQIVVHPKDPVTLPRDRVLEVTVRNRGETSEGVKRGSLIGLAAGFAVGMIIGNATDSVGAGVGLGAATFAGFLIPWALDPPGASPRRIVLYRVPGTRTP